MPAPNLLSAVEAVDLIRGGELTASDLARACLDRVHARDGAVKGWAHLEPDLVMAQARALDAAPTIRPLHGVTIAVKDVILTADMPTRNNSPLYENSFPAIDAACVKSLRAAGAIIFGKTDTTEFAAVTRGGKARNPYDALRSPGGSSSGSAAVIADGQATIGLGTQTAGSTIRPASFCGVYAMKPSWNAISREGLKMLAASLDTLGLFTRSAEDLAILADVFAFEDRVSPRAFALEGARIAACPSPAWPKAEPATRDVFERGCAMLREAGATVVPLDLPAGFDALAGHQATVMAAEARVSLLSEAQASPGLLHDDLKAMVDNRKGITKTMLLDAYDAAARARVAFDSLGSEFDAVLTPSAVGEAPLGTITGDASFNLIWTLLHVPVINIPGMTGSSGLPVGLSLVAPRYRDRHLIEVARAVGPLFKDRGKAAQTLF
jgi:Asp-tRNA(Asn)/Glu-tRNA(Gln) amidotransferase A subunit family amidase